MLKLILITSMKNTVKGNGAYQSCIQEESRTSLMRKSTQAKMAYIEENKLKQNYLHDPISKGHNWLSKGNFFRCMGHDPLMVSLK